jgi:hypothetical protein
MVDATYFKLLPTDESVVTAEEAEMLEALFGEHGKLPARREN